MAETFRIPNAVRDIAQGYDTPLALQVRTQESIDLETVIQIRSQWGSEWAQKIIDQLSAKSALLKSEEGSHMIENRDTLDGENAYGMANSVMAADASIDAAQSLLEQIIDSNPVAAQAYYLLVAADASLDSVIEGLGLSDPDEEAAESTDDGDETPAVEMNSADETAEDRASAARIGEGSFVSWGTSTGRGRGKVEKVITKGQATSTEGYTLEATPDHPVFQIRIYKEQGNGWVPTDTVNVQRSDILTLISALPHPRSEELDMIEDRKAMEKAERITMISEVRAVATDDGSLKIGGYAATFNSEATGLNFREVIAPGAFTRALATNDPVFLLVNHDMEGIPLASTQSGTLQLRQDDTGLYMEATLDPANPKAQELSSALRRGDMDKMSFAFTVSPDGQTREAGLRTIEDIDRLYEVSVVTLPAYDSTSVGMRDAQEIDLELAKRKLQLKFKQYSLTRKSKA